MSVSALTHRLQRGMSSQIGLAAERLRRTIWRRRIAGMGWTAPALAEITIIIKTLERPDCLLRLLASIRASYPDVVVRVADDGNQPYRDGVLARFPDVDYVILPHDSGVSAGRNALLDGVETPYFMLLDDDHLFCPETRIETYAAILVHGPFDIVGGDVLGQSKSGRLRHRKGFAGNFLWDGPRQLRIVPLRQRIGAPITPCDVVQNAFLGRTETFRRTGLRWDDGQKIVEHEDFFLRARELGVRVAHTGAAWVGHAGAMPAAYAPYRQERLMHYQRRFMEKHGLETFTRARRVLRIEALGP